MSDSLRPHGLEHARPPCPSSLGVCSDSCPLSWWCHPTIFSSVVPFSSCLQSFPASGSSLISQIFTSGGQSIGVSGSASVLPMNIQDWFPLGLTGLISLQPHELQHARLPRLSLSPRICSNSCSLTWGCYLIITSSAAPSPPALNLSHHQGLFQWVSCSHQVARVLELQLWHQSFRWRFGIDFL